jgi:hypothetical protein
MKQFQDLCTTNRLSRMAYNVDSYSLYEFLDYAPRGNVLKELALVGEPGHSSFRCHRGNGWFQEFMPQSCMDTLFILKGMVHDLLEERCKKYCDTLADLRRIRQNPTSTRLDVRVMRFHLGL